MIFFDTETTGLIREALPLEMQPRIIEVGLIKTNESGDEQERFSSLVNPGIALPAEITKITGLTDADLADAPAFPEVLPDLVAKFLGESHLVAHNVHFDLMMLVYELQRIDWQWRFPFPPMHIDTVPLARAACGSGKLENWSKHVLGEAHLPQTHRAIDDVERLIACWRSTL